ncbi:MAG TPA: sigma-70 family RNA polymerase sigma factor [Actinomycetota bacterium]|nr:sigma-70 family RNA polymerase sigma factor [Actinomycetota bacterium]
MPEPWSFERFFEEHQPRLFGAMCLITGDRQEAEEIAQEAFARVWERWDRVSEIEDPAGFLFRTATNVFRNRLRRAAVALRRSFAPSPPADALAAVEDRDDLLRALRPLTPRQRAALVLTGYLGYTAVEAARVLGIRPSTVRALTTQGRSTARSHLEAIG